jgi:hypothetical protein
MEKNSLPSNSHFSSFSLQQFPIETSSLEALQITSTRAFSTSTSTSVAALSEKKISRSQILQKPPKTPNHFKSHSLSLQEVPTPWTTRISEFEPNFDENINRSRGLSLDQSPQGNNGTQSRWVPIHSLSRGSIKEKSLNASKSKQTSNIKHKASKNLNDWLSEFSFFSEEDLSEEVEEDEIDKPIDVESPCTSSSSPSNDVEQVKEEDEVDKPIEATSSTVSSIQVCTSSSPLSTEEVPLAFTPPYVPNKEVKEDDVDKSATPKVGFVRVCASSSMDEVRTPIYVLEHKEEQDENIGSDGSTKTLQASLSVTSLGNCSSLSSIPRLISSSQCRTTSRLLLFPATAERNLRPYQPEDLDRMEGEMFMREKPRLQRRHLSDHLSLSPNASNLAHILSLQLPEDIISARTAATLEAENDPVLSVDTAPVRSSFKTTSFSRTKTTFGLRPIQEPRKQSTTKQRKTPLEILGEVPLTGYDSMMPKTSLIPLSVLALAENCKQKPMPSVVCTCFQKSMHPRSMQQCAAHFKFEIPEEGEIDEEGYEGDGYLDGDGSLVVEEHDKCPPLAPLDTPFEDGINRSQTSPAGSPTLPPVSSGATSLSAPLSPSRSRASKRVEPPMILINSTISMDLENHVETIIQGQEENRDKFTPKKVSRPQYTFGRKLTSYVQ